MPLVDVRLTVVFVNGADAVPDPSCIWTVIGNPIGLPHCPTFAVKGGVMNARLVGGNRTVVTAEAVLLPGVLSFGDETVAEFVIEPAVSGAVTTMVMFGAEPGARLPLVRVQVTVAVPTQFQFVPVALTNAVPAGSVSTTVTADASFGPALLTPIV